MSRLDGQLQTVGTKFGTLRYYCAPSGDPSAELWDTFDDIVDEAERAPAITCERCGEPGLLHETNHLVKTLCASCAETLGYAPMPSRDHNAGEH